MMAPYGDKYSWDKKLLAALAVLSECLVAQEAVAGRLVLYSVKARAKREGPKADVVVRSEDVVEIVRSLLGDDGGKCCEDTDSGTEHTESDTES